MKHPFLPGAFVLLALLQLRAEVDLPASRLMPDTVVMNDGTRIQGLIIRNDATEVVLQKRMEEVEIPKSHIRRIEDGHQTLVYFADIVDPGKLPPWRMIVQDLRSDDNIRTFRQVPATKIETGYLRNIPYLSFRINKRIEMNVYGDPEHPVCLEFGVYERGEKITRFKKIIRAYLAGILSSRQEIDALYKVDEKGGECRGGNFLFKVLPPTAPEAFGGWWISLYDPKRLESARLPDAAYRKVTLPFRDVYTAAGTLREDRIAKDGSFLSRTMAPTVSKIPDLRGFYRDRMGDLKLLFSHVPGNKPATPSPSPRP